MYSLLSSRVRAACKLSGSSLIPTCLRKPTQAAPTRKIVATSLAVRRPSSLNEQAVPSASHHHHRRGAVVAAGILASTSSRPLGLRETVPRALVQRKKVAAQRHD
ncbi:hypothetical protein EJ03DRAFT_40498 [Teratosphaeria nubilosa]|uniref:Uncharacterized protein n=1 Tax=Teratosphaeria nubilosa TaxID=161662 RepID=A0A6G1KV38_9PEZI|nr:hypothetical protein EJ03DRAFT_40498 [Teratosphaeria nubilosa]